MRVFDVQGNIVASMNDWKSYFANSRVKRNNNIITWDGYEKRWLSENISVYDFLALVENRQYSFQVVNDGSIFQLFYEFDRNGKKLQKASLGFYASPTEFDQEETGLDAPMEYKQEKDINIIIEQQDFLYQKDTNRWLRIDYDNNMTKNVVHGDCHLHIGGLPNSRILVRGVPGPAQFIEWIMSLFYPDVYKEHRIDNIAQIAESGAMRNVNRYTISFQDHDVYKHITHLTVPTIL